MTPRARTPSTRGGGRTSTWTGTERSSRSSGPAAHTTDVSQVWRRRARTSGPRATVVVPSPLARASPTEGRIASARSVSGRAGHQPLAVGRRRRRVPAGRLLPVQPDQGSGDPQREEEGSHRHREREAVEERERDRTGSDPRDEREGEVARLLVGPTTTASPEDHDGGDRDRDERDRPDDAAAHEQPEVGVVEDAVLREERAEAAADPRCVLEELHGDGVAVRPRRNAGVVPRRDEHAADRAEQGRDPEAQEGTAHDDGGTQAPAHRPGPAGQQHDESYREGEVGRA